jgi:hypothetical protein
VKEKYAMQFCPFYKGIVKETLLLFLVVYIHSRISAIPKENFKKVLI